MMGKHQFAPKLYYELSLARLVPQNHLLRQISAAIDFSFVYPLARPYYSHTGQPSIDPIVLFKTLLVGFLYGVTSERRLMADTQVNLAYRWFLGYDLDEAIPDHSVLSKARARFGMEVFEKFFQRSIELCRQAGLLSDGPVYVDSTVVRAAASLDSLVRKEDVITPPLSVKDYVQKLYTENDQPQTVDVSAGEKCPSDGDDETAAASTCPAPVRGSRKPARYDMIRGDSKHHKTNREVISRTDPEATVVIERRLGLQLAYKAHMSVAGKQGKVITAAVATTGAKHDSHLLEEVLQNHQRFTGLTAKEVVADAGYGTLDNYLLLEERGATAFIPPRERFNEPRGIWGKEHFRYVREQDIYICPANKTMRLFSRSKCKRRLLYRAQPGTCAACQFKEKCTRSGNDREVSRFFDQDVIDRAKARLKDPAGHEIFRQRKTRIEGIFAMCKELHGMRRTRFMGKWRVQIQVWLTAAAINIKRAVRELLKAGPIPTHHPHPLFGQVYPRRFFCLQTLTAILATLMTV